MRRIVFLVLLAALAAPASAQDAMRYVGDELVLVLRDVPRADGAARGTVVSGARVQVLEGETAGYARVRTPDGREGWILARYLQREPIAREKLGRVEKDFSAAQAELKKLKDEHARLLQDFARLSGGEPVASRELVAETEALRAQLAQRGREVAEARAAYDAERARQRTLVIGGGLVAAGVLLSLLLRWLWPRKRWRDF